MGCGATNLTTGRSISSWLWTSQETILAVFDFTKNKLNHKILLVKRVKPHTLITPKGNNQTAVKREGIYTQKGESHTRRQF